LPDFGNLGIGFVLGEEKNVLDVDAIGNLILLEILQVLRLELGIGDVDVLSDLIDVH